MSDLEVEVTCSYTPYEPANRHSDAVPANYKVHIDSWHSILGGFVGGGAYDIRGPQMNTDSIKEFAERLAEVAYLEGVRDGAMLSALVADEVRSDARDRLLAGLVKLNTEY